MAELGQGDELATVTPISSRLGSDKPTFVSIWGKKGSGKSVMARRLWDTWPGDEFCIDVCADALGPGDVDQSYTFVPDVWPERVREDEPVRIRYVPDSRSATYYDDLDRAVGFASRRKGSLLWIDEIGVVSRVNRTGPNMNHLLMQGRHDRMSVLFCGPRPINVDPLVLHQSDYVYVFLLPNPNDRRRVADSCGIDPKTLDAAVHVLGDHEYLRWDGRELVHFPPLPMKRARPPRSR
jgi:hypothetical protein